MRFAMLTAGTQGDVEPYVALAAGLRRAGHQVRLATHEGFRDLAARPCVDVVPMPQPPAELTALAVVPAVAALRAGVAGFLRGFARATRAGRPVIEGTWTPSGPPATASTP
jgi:hypothetical protein